MTWTKHLTLLAIALLMAATFPASAGSLPPLINFQSVLLDEGGNLLPSGPTTIQFQILDENRTPIYSESQSIEVVKGAAAALIGNGADTKGAATGGIPEDIFATGAPRYLQVQVGSHAPEDPMTIVPVPYSQWSATCATVADGGVKPASIANAAVGFEALAPDVVSKLADAMSKSQGVVTAQSLGSTGGATQVGVTAKFINSGSTSVQGVLQDIDLSVKKGQETDTFLTGKLNQEVTDRSNAIQSLKNNEIKQVSDALAQETVNRTSADGGLQGQITPIQTMLQNINNIPGKLALDHLEPTSSAINDLNMGGKKITNLGTPSTDTDASTKKYVDATAANIVALIPKAESPLPPLLPALSGDVNYSDFLIISSTATGEVGIKFIPFNEADTLATDPISSLSYISHPYTCKVIIKFNTQNPNSTANSEGVYATCEYSERVKKTFPTANFILQRGVLVHVYAPSVGGPKILTERSYATVHFDLYQIQVATQ